ncbi:MAG: hypothetical protein ABI947_10870 [Chloroflexota bacterium]
MSNIDFFNPGDIPQPRDNIKVERVDAQPYSDGWRVKVIVDVTPFQERPSLEIRVRSSEGRLVSEMTVIETMIRHMEFTVHIRGVQSPVGHYVIEVDLYYGEDPTQAQHKIEIPFSIEAPNP